MTPSQEGNADGDKIINSQSKRQLVLFHLEFGACATAVLFQGGFGRRKSDVWRNRVFREIRQIYLFSSRAICRRTRGAGGRVRKNSPDGHKAPIVVSGGLPPLSPAGTGRQLRARAKDEPGGYLFSFCRQTHRVWSIRMAIRFETAQKKRGSESEARKRFISSSPAPGLLIGIKRQVAVEVRKDSIGLGTILHRKHRKKYIFYYILRRIFIIDIAVVRNVCRDFFHCNFIYVFNLAFSFFNAKDHKYPNNSTVTISSFAHSSFQLRSLAISRTTAASVLRSAHTPSAILAEFFALYRSHRPAASLVQ